MYLRHSCNDNNSHKSTGKNQEQPNIVQQRQEPISKDDERTAGPGYKDKCDVDVPRFNDEVWMEKGIHLYNDIRRDRDNRGEVEDPAKVIERAGEEANNAPISRARCYRSPMIHPPCRWY